MDYAIIGITAMVISYLVGYYKGKTDTWTQAYFSGEKSGWNQAMRRQL